VRNVVKDLTAEISEKVPLTVARARVCAKSDLLHGAMVPDRRASSGGKYLRGNRSWSTVAHLPTFANLCKPLQRLSDHS
jgi:hypothetical protein